MAATDLCTLVDVRAWLQKKATETEQDDVIAMLITQASAAIMRHYRREFAAPSGSSSRTFRWDQRSPYLDLAPFDAEAISAVRLDPASTNYTDLASTDWTAVPVHQPDGVYTGLHLEARTLDTGTRRGFRLVRVTAEWGFPSIPPDVALACAKQVTRWMRGEVQAFTATANLESDQFPSGPTALAPDVRALLQPYMRAPF